MNENGLNYIDLFAGAGGLSEGFIQSGYRPVAHVEMNEHAAKTIETRIASDVKKSLVSSANLSYHGMQGNIEMGFLIESHDKAKQIEEVMKEMVRMKVCGKYQ